MRSYASKTGKSSVQTTQSEKLQPVGPITPGVVIYAIIKDQILMQFLQGFGTAVFFMLLAPYGKYMVNSGRRWGMFARSRLVGFFKGFGNTGGRAYRPSFSI